MLPHGLYLSSVALPQGIDGIGMVLPHGLYLSSVALPQGIDRLGVSLPQCLDRIGVSLPQCLDRLGVKLPSGLDRIRDRVDPPAEVRAESFDLSVDSCRFGARAPVDARLHGIHVAFETRDLIESRQGFGFGGLVREASACWNLPSFRFRSPIMYMIRMRCKPSRTRVKLSRTC